MGKVSLSCNVADVLIFGISIHCKGESDSCLGEAQSVVPEVELWIICELSILIEALFPELIQEIKMREWLSFRS